MYTLRASLLFSLTSLLLPTFILATPTPTRRGRPEPYEPPCNSCLNPNEIYPIASRWLNVFATDGLAGLDMATTEDVQYWNEEFTYPGSPEPYANNRTQLAERIGYSAGTWTACEKISFEIVSAWNSCDRIAVRWKQHAVVSGDYKQATAKEGTEIQFSGIDLLTVDLKSGMVSNAETSSDRMNYYAAVGIDPFVK